MKQFKDPFEAAFEEQDESPPESPIHTDGFPPPASANPPDTAAAAVNPPHDEENYDDEDEVDAIDAPSTSTQNIPASASVVPVVPKAKENDDEEEEEENMDVELGKLPSGGDPDKLDKMKKILSQFTDEQMNRYESFRRSGFQKATMKRLLVSITGTQKISVPMTIVMSGIAKMFVGELVETARVVMTERKESGPIRPCHIRESYRRVKLEGRVPKRTIPRLFR